MKPLEADVMEANESAELRRLLVELSDALAPAHEAMQEVRHRIEACWPRKPSLKVLKAVDAEGYDLYKTAVPLVVAGGRSEWGVLPMTIDAGKYTVDAFELEMPPSLDVGTWEWNLSRVDMEAPSDPEPSAAVALREALSQAQESNRRLCRLLDDVGRRAPPEAWLPDWNIDNARRYIATVKWQSARPPQPPHQYTIRDWRHDLRHDFLAFAQFIQSRGVLKTWGKYVLAYLDVDGLDYWTMGARVPETTVINCAPVGASEAAQPVPATLDTRLVRAVERARAYRRSGASEDCGPGTLGERLHALLPHRG